ncbi:MAG: TetR family transcriptional regulator [Propionibacteriaceae bacterium]|nr:TetR family transcriptional regulator [Propionibacteriaceae bacterium]
MAGARMGRPLALTRDAIAQAVLDVGFAHLTVAAVRARLGVGQTTLYRYAADRDELVRIGLDHILGNAAWPSLDGHWRETLDRYALALWRLWEAHPRAAAEAARGVLPKTMLFLTGELCAVLLRQGFTPDNAILACDIVFDLVTDNRRDIEQHASTTAMAALHAPGVESRPGGLGEAELGPRATETEQGIIHAALTRAFSAEPLDWFTRKLRVALDGVEQSLAPEVPAK